MSDTLHCILTHKSFEYPRDICFDYDDVCCFAQKKIKTNLPFKKYKLEGYDDRLVGEYSLWQYILDNDKTHDWFVLHHYRRFLVNQYHTLCTAQPIVTNCSLLQQTIASHSVKLAQILKAILSPQDFNSLNSINVLTPYNMMSIHRSVLSEWCKFMKFYIDKIFDILGTRDYDTLLDQIKSDSTFTSNVMPNGQINESKNCDPAYQVRIVAFLSERLNTLWWLNREHYIGEVKLLENDKKHSLQPKETLL
jgi:hypothetical protein